jgi:hypothetical protein
LANDVSRFSRLFSAQVCAEPDDGDDRAEARIGDDVRPRRRRFPIAFEHDDVGAPVVGKPAQSVGEGERGTADWRSTCRRSRGEATSDGRAGGSSGGSDVRSSYGRSNCAAQRAAIALEDARAAVDSSTRALAGDVVACQ